MSFAPTLAPPPPDVVDVIDDADDVADVFDSTTTSDVDSDGDGLSDQDEVAIYGMDPAVIDTDCDQALAEEVVLLVTYVPDLNPPDAARADVPRTDLACRRCFSQIPSHQR